MNKGTRVFWMLMVSVCAVFTLGTGAAFGADPLKGEKKQAVREAKQDIKALKQEKVASLHAIKDGFKSQQADLKRLYKEGKITKAQYKAQLKDLRKTMRTTLKGTRAEFQASLGLTRQDLKDLRKALKGVSNSDEIIAALEEFNKEFDSVVNELNSYLMEIAKETGIDFKDIIVSVS
jgi:myosin heavy subunit